ncbi:MAG: hypothetical protein J7J31_10860 [Helicobacteraceae bacterium]|nr:hypothetical protein [Helicobacteraceae bacterium]
MKLGKLSLIAALALSSTLYAESDMKVSGHAKLWYQTMDHGGINDKGLFSYDSAAGNEWGDLGVQLKATGSFNDHITYGVALNGVTSLGLENHLVGAETTRNNWTTNTGGVNGTSSQPFWFHEVFINYKAAENTNVKLGRQELDTPLAFTEKWNATSNSFEALVAVNSDLPDTTLVAAWISKGNGATSSIASAPQVFGAETQFNGYMRYNELGNKGGALAVAAINNSIQSLPLQAWIYHIPQVANAIWVQADASAKDMGPLNSASLQVIGASIGTQGAAEDALKADAFGTGNIKTGDTTALAAKVAMSAGMFNAYAAFSTISEGNLPVANTATNYKKTKLPTASIFSDGMVAAQPDTTSFKVGAGAKFDGVGTLAVSYASYDVGKNAGYQNPNVNSGGPASMGFIAQNIVQDDIDLREIDVVFKTKIKDIDVAAMYIDVDKTYVPGGANYGTYDNKIVRIVATLNF